jgi:hypothetical protein
LLLIGTTYLKNPVQGREISMNYYYTAREAQQRLGMGVGAFYYLVDTGRIKKLAPPGKQRGFYSKHLIEKLAKERTAGITCKKVPEITFLKATQDDIHEEYELATLLLNGSMGYGLPTYEAWLRYNPDSNFIVRDRGRLVAFMQMLPLKRETIKQWLNGEIREWEIGAADVLPYEAGSSVECIITSIATTADVDTWKRRVYGMRLVRGFQRFLVDLAKQGITITRFYAASAAPDGLSLLRKAKFEERGYIGKRVVFELDPIAAENRVAKA